MPANDAALDILADLASHPAAPFHEDAVARRIVERLSGMGLSPRRDEFGNVIARYSNADGSDPPIAFVAHMDHPGFEIDEVDGEGLQSVLRLNRLGRSVKGYSKSMEMLVGSLAMMWLREGWISYQRVL